MKTLKHISDLGAEKESTTKSFAYVWQGRDFPNYFQFSIPENQGIYQGMGCGSQCKTRLDRKNPNTNKGRLGILDECNWEISYTSLYREEQLVLLP